MGRLEWVTENQFETLAGIAIVVCGLSLLSRRSALPTALMLTAVGAAWLLEVWAGASLLVHRVVLGAARWITSAVGVRPA